jgi:hypothetical protein
MSRPRWLPQKNFPPYAYLPGKEPHPVRDPMGHSYHVEPILVAAEASLGSDVFLWGLDLFNYGYYWEAHEAWESLWQVAERGSSLRMLFKGIVTLAKNRPFSAECALTSRPLTACFSFLRSLRAQWG